MEENRITLEENLKYLSMNKIQRFFYDFIHFFTHIPFALSRKMINFPFKFKSFVFSIGIVFRNIYIYFSRGDIFTRFSYIFMGLGLLKRKQILRGILYFVYEIFFIVYQSVFGIPSFIRLFSLGISDDNIYIKDNSFTIILYFVFYVLLLVLFFYLWYNQIKESYKLEILSYLNLTLNDIDLISRLKRNKFHTMLLSIPMTGLIFFTIVPSLIIIFLSFMDYDFLSSSNNLFTWIGGDNYANALLSSTSGKGLTNIFARVFLWTLIFSFASTLITYFFGMFIAIILQNKKLRFRNVFRNILCISIAAPQFIIVLVLSVIFRSDDLGLLNGLFMKFGWIESPIDFLTSDQFYALLPKLLILLVNAYLGIPYSMLIFSALVNRIPKEKYEIASLEGVKTSKLCFKVTLPYLLYITTPYFIFQFISSFHAFNSIYLFSLGGPGFADGSILSNNVGQTDTIFTWIYKLLTNSNFNYSLGFALGVLLFAFVFLFILIFRKHINSLSQEGGRKHA